MNKSLWASKVNRISAFFIYAGRLARLAAVAVGIVFLIAHFAPELVRVVVFVLGNVFLKEAIVAFPGIATSNNRIA
jgi:hypothetical protein